MTGDNSYLIAEYAMHPVTISFFYPLLLLLVDRFFFKQRIRQKIVLLLKFIVSPLVYLGRMIPYQIKRRKKIKHNWYVYIIYIDKNNEWHSVWWTYTMQSLSSQWHFGETWVRFDYAEQALDYVKYQVKWSANLWIMHSEKHRIVYKFYIPLFE